MVKFGDIRKTLAGEKRVVTLPSVDYFVCTEAQLVQIVERVLDEKLKPLDALIAKLDARLDDLVPNPKYLYGQEEWQKLTADAVAAKYPGSKVVSARGITLPQNLIDAGIVGITGAMPPDVTTATGEPASIEQMKLVWKFLGIDKFVDLE